MIRILCQGRCLAVGDADYLCTVLVSVSERLDRVLGISGEAYAYHDITLAHVKYLLEHFACAVCPAARKRRPRGQDLSMVG